MIVSLASNRFFVVGFMSDVTNTGMGERLSYGVSRIELA